MRPIDVGLFLLPTEYPTDAVLLTVYRSRRPHESDTDALAKARREAAAQTVVAKPKVVGAGRRELATDDQVNHYIPLVAL